MYIWLGSQLDPTFVQSVFGFQTASQIQPEKVGKIFFNFKNSISRQCRVVELDNPISKNVRTLLNIIRDERNSYMKVC